jgi:hypothetical protein
MPLWEFQILQMYDLWNDTKKILHMFFSCALDIQNTNIRSTLLKFVLKSQMWRVFLFICILSTWHVSRLAAN